MAPTTGFEDSGGVDWTTLGEERTFLETIAAETSATLSQVGDSVNENPMWRVDLGSPTRGTLLVTALVHGSELACREGVLSWIRDLAYSTDMAITDYLASHRLVVMPTCNPDGVAVGGQFTNQNGIDINRDVFAFQSPEQRAMMTVIPDADATLRIDCHEGSTNVTPNDVRYTHARWVSYYSEIATMGLDAIAALQTDLDSNLITHDTYLVPSRKSGAQIAGAFHSVGILLETLNTNPRLDRHAHYQVMLESLREWHGDNDEALLEMQDASRSYQAGTGDTYVLEHGTTNVPWPQTVLPADLTGYELATSLPTLQQQAYGIVVSGDQVSLSQEARAVIPVLLDEESDDQLLTTTRLFVPVAPSDPLPQVAQAQLQAAMSWLACDLGSGVVLGTLPDLVVDEVSRVIGAYTSSRIDLPIPSVGGRDLSLSQRAALAMARTEPARTMLVALVNDIPLWAGIPLRERWGTSASAPLAYASVDAYLRHRYVRDHDWVNQDISSVIAAGLLGDANAGVNGQGTGLGLVIDARPTGVLRERHYRFHDFRTVYDALVELMGVQAGPEWTVDIDWAPGQVGRVISLIARVDSRLGVATTGPAAVFSSDAFSSTGVASASYDLDLDYSDGAFANVVYAYSSGEGEDQPVSAPAIDTGQLGSGTPVWEKAYQPSSSISTQSVLNDHAIAELARVREGHQSLQVSAVWNAYPRYGLDWQLGDDVGARLRGHAHPDGLVGVRRAIGFRLKPSVGTIAPILQEDI